MTCPFRANMQEMLEPAPSTKLNKVTHCIFDMDGLLLDTEVVYDQILKTIAADHKKTLPSEIRYQILGTNEGTTAQIAIKGMGLPITEEQFLDRFHELCNKLLTNCPLMKGAERLVRHLRTNKIPIAVATSSSEPQFKLKTEKHRELFDLFHHIVCGTTDPEVKAGKPAPDIYLVAAARFPDKPEPSMCLVFEDAPNGIKAGRAAKMQAIMVPDPMLPEELRQEATLVLKSLLDFKPEIVGLPPFDKSSEIACN